MKLVDRKGKRYGKLIVLERDWSAKSKFGYAMWHCKCDCGKETVQYFSGNTKSCGCSKQEYQMSRTKNLIGLRFGSLLVLRKERDSCEKPIWLCKCDCGKEKMASYSALINGLIKSCGCIWRLSEGEAAFHRIYTKMKKGALRRNINWGLTLEEIRPLITTRCFYCGQEPKQGQGLDYKNYNGNFLYNGLDRKNSSLGYTIENVVPCCKTCNFSKRLMSVEEFQNWIRRVYAYSCRPVEGKSND